MKNRPIKIDKWREGGGKGQDLYIYLIGFIKFAFFLVAQSKFNISPCTVALLLRINQYGDDLWPEILNVTEPINISICQKTKTKQKETVLCKKGFFVLRSSFSVLMSLTIYLSTSTDWIYMNMWSTTKQSIFV